jgi:hypothetical protein
MDSSDGRTPSTEALPMTPELAAHFDRSIRAATRKFPWLRPIEPEPPPPVVRAEPQAKAIPVQLAFPWGELAEATMMR